jgi:hypothetical protein
VAGTATSRLVIIRALNVPRRRRVLTDPDDADTVGQRDPTMVGVVDPHLLDGELQETPLPMERADCPCLTSHFRVEQRADLHLCPWPQPGEPGPSCGALLQEARTDHLVPLEVSRFRELVSQVAGVVQIREPCLDVVDGLAQNPPLGLPLGQRVLKPPLGDPI